MTPQPGRRLLFRSSEVSADSVLASRMAEFVTRVGHPHFPCTFASRALARNELFFAAVNPAADPRPETAAALDELATLLVADPDAVAVLFLPGTESLAEDRAFFRDLICYLCEYDRVGWPPDQPMDPQDPAWVMWYAGVGFFLNLSSDHHRLRRSRNLGPGLTVIAQARSSFDRYAGDGTVRAHIRRRVEAYDDVAVHPALGNYGDEHNRESHQYFLGDDTQDESLLTLADIAAAAGRRQQGQPR